jgi:hypothetical protein
MGPWIDLKLTVRTPMFLGATAGAPAELRMPSLRGVARFWFRALAAPAFDADDHEAVARAEAEVFGAAAGGAGAGMAGPSPVAFRLLRAPRPDTNRAPKWLRVPVDDARPDHGIGYLLGQGLYQPPNENRPNPELACRSYFPPDPSPDPDKAAVFAVRVTPSRRSGAPSASYVREIVGISLWAAATFGGLGARTRRGFGGFDLTGLDELCAAATDRTGPARDHPAIRRLHDLVAERHHGQVPDLSPPPPLGTGGAPWPSAPTCARWHIRTSDMVDTWPQLLHQAGCALRAFRAPVDRAAPPHSMTGLARYKRWVTHEYVDAVVPALRGRPPTSRTASAASFGLPLVFGKAGATINLREGADELRRASPVWIRTTRRADGRYQLLYHVFEAAIGPAGAGVALSTDHRNEPMHLDERLAYQTIANFLATGP